MRRPLAWAALAFVAAVRLITLILPLPLPDPPFEDGQEAVFEGEVTDLVSYTDAAAGVPVKIISLKNAVLFNSDRIDSEKISQSLQQNTEYSEASFGMQKEEGIGNGALQEQEFCILCRLKAEETLPEIGSRVRCEGKIRLFAQATNPGEFDSRAYYYRQGYAFELRSAVITGKSREYSHFRQTLYLLKGRLSGALDALLPDKEASVAKAMLLGEKKGMDAGIKELYQQAGISHILAISGLHISLLGMGVYRLLSRFLGKSAACGVSCLFLLSYLCMTGFSASSMRAAVSFLLTMTAILVGRTYDGATALAVAAALLLVGSPGALENAGFDLSFTAALGAVIVVPAFQRMQEGWDWLLHCFPGSGGAGRLFRPASGMAEPWYKARMRILTEAVRMGARVSFCISMATLPVLLNAYYEWNICSLLINIIVVPLMGILLGCCILLAVAGSVLLWAAPGLLFLLYPFAVPVRAILRLYELLCRLAVRPAGRFRPGAPELWQAVVFYLGILLLVLFAKKLPRLAGYAGAALLCLVFLLDPFRAVRFTMLDVGQGECVFLDTGKGRYLYDGGSTSKSSTGTWQIIPFLKHEGVNRLELIFVSHWDEDHINGIKEVLEWAGEGNLEVGGLVLAAAGPEDEAYCGLTEAAYMRDIAVYRMEAGDCIQDGNCRFLALYPSAGEKIADRNEASLVLRFSCIKEEAEVFSALLTGDVTAAGERRILEAADASAACPPGGTDVRAACPLSASDASVACPPDVANVPAADPYSALPCTALQIAHHGSDSSSTADFLDAVSPRLALISCGRDNSYGHPHEEVLERLEERGIPVLVTARCGAISLRLRGDKITVETFLDID